MGYLFLITALLTGAAKGYCGKKTSTYVERFGDAVFANLLRMSFCILIGLCTVAVTDGFSALAIPLAILPIPLFSGICTALFVVSWLISVRSGAYMMMDVFCMVGMLIPMLGGLILYREPIRPMQWVGCALLLCATCIMCSYNNSIKKKLTPASVLLLIFCGITNGCTDFSQKMFVRQAAEIPIAVFNFYTYVAAALVLGICLLLTGAKQQKEQSAEKTDFKPILLYIAIMSVCLFCNSYFKTASAALLPAAILYPLYQGAALILSTGMSAVLFHEKLTWKGIVGILLSFVSLMIVNFL